MNIIKNRQYAIRHSYVLKIPDGFSFVNHVRCKL